MAARPHTTALFVAVVQSILERVRRLQFRGRADASGLSRHGRPLAVVGFYRAALRVAMQSGLIAHRT